MGPKICIHRNFARGHTHYGCDGPWSHLWLTALGWVALIISLCFECIALWGTGLWRALNTSLFSMLQNNHLTEVELLLNNSKPGAASPTHISDIRLQEKKEVFAVNYRAQSWAWFPSPPGRWGERPCRRNWAVSGSWLVCEACDHSFCWSVMVMSCLGGDIYDDQMGFHCSRN